MGERRRGHPPLDEEPELIHARHPEQAGAARGRRRTPGPARGRSRAEDIDLRSSPSDRASRGADADADGERRSWVGGRRLETRVPEFGVELQHLRDPSDVHLSSPA